MLSDSPWRRREHHGGDPMKDRSNRVGARRKEINPGKLTWKKVPQHNWKD